MSFGIELGILAAVRDGVDRDANSEDACGEKQDKRENMSMNREKERQTYRVHC
jgi:hypothetical protein